MSVLPNETIKIIGETAGIANISDEIASQLASDVEYRIREIAQEAIKFMKHSKRETMTTDDINNALRLRNIDMLYGYNSSSNEVMRFSKTHTPTQAIYFINDKELSFRDVIQQPLPKCPREPTLKAHWLAIEGSQPLIPQNPSPYEKEEYFKNLLSKNKNKKQNIDNNNNISGGGGGSGGGGSGTSTDSTNKKIDNSVPGIQSLTSTATVVAKPTVKHILSKEIQMYYEKITNSMKSDNKELFEASIQSLKTDSSLHQLLPYFTNFISTQVTQNLTNLELLLRLMQMTHALLDSKFMKPELYLHQMMPSILTCLVGRKLCNSPTENHWKLREYSAKLVALICRKFGDSYNSLQGRVTKTLVQTLHDTTKPLTTHYGAIVGLSSLGRNVIQLLLIPYIPKYYQLLEPELTNPSNQQKAMEAHKVLNILVEAVGKFFMWISEGENILTIIDIKKEQHQQQQQPDKNLQNFDYNTILSTLQSNYQSLFDIFGEKLLPFIKKKETPLIP
ncbi:TATA-binding protein-associated-factor [Tieghemostelium lacteum]|uniref:TATA-binding protein-associated-factor n=1 Tax=Tieghemostelium lacteum TaxID=361077 RepID=A0A152A6Y6_TIELA|nr:TATA-binding protein-associated-factor [Tieghemostelium lacteum]|eukprot:KYR01993.1 TATA-binding protein-associated-factor [Tieghemostelium lacteum]